MRELSLPEPVFENLRGTFAVTLYNAPAASFERHPDEIDDPKDLLTFCRIPRTRAEIEAYLAIPSKQYALRRYLNPLVEAGLILLENPDHPRSKSQRYRASEDFL